MLLFLILIIRNYNNKKNHFNNNTSSVCIVFHVDLERITTYFYQVMWNCLNTFFKYPLSMFYSNLLFKKCIKVTFLAVAVVQLVSLLLNPFSVSFTWAVELIDPLSPPPPSIIQPDPSMNSLPMIRLIVAPSQTFVSHFLYLLLPFFSLKQLPPQLITFTHPSLHLLFPFMRHFQ